MFLDQISILEGFLKDYEAMMTGVMVADNSALPSQRNKLHFNIFQIENYFSCYKKKVILICNNISQ